jgi:hypothetical protein
MQVWSRASNDAVTERTTHVDEVDREVVRWPDTLRVAPAELVVDARLSGDASRHPDHA